MLAGLRYARYRRNWQGEGQSKQEISTAKTRQLKGAPSVFKQQKVKNRGKRKKKGKSEAVGPE